MTNTFNTDSDEFLNSFVDRMRLRMKTHDEQKGSTWKYTTTEMLNNLLIEKMREYEISENPDKILIDIANYVYFLWIKRQLLS